MYYAPNGAQLSFLAGGFTNMSLLNGAKMICCHVRWMPSHVGSAIASS
jgi:hypothetical protein